MPISEEACSRSGSPFLPSQGKRGGWRVLLGFQAGKKAFFLYLFSKNSRDNIEDDEMKALKRLA